jgi:hypothetical protein
MKQVNIAIPVGTDVGTQFQLTLGGGAVAQDSEFAGFEQYGNNQTWLAYASQMWQRTAGRFVIDVLTDFTPLEANGLLPVSLYEIRWLNLIVTKLPKTGRRYGDDPRAYDLGFVQFAYPGGAKGPLQRISFTQCEFHPEWSSAQGVYVYLRKGCEASWLVGGTSGALKSPTYDDNPVDWLTDSTGGWNDLSGSILFGSIEANNNMDIPAFSGGLPVTFHQTGNIEQRDLFADTLHTGAMDAALTAYLAEAWQWLAAPELGAATGGFDISGTGMYSVGGSYIKSAHLVITPPANNDPNKFGVPNVFYYGAWAISSFDYKMPLKYINGDINWLQPDGNYANAVWIWLKPGVTGHLTLVTSPVNQRGITTKNGYVSLETGEWDGLNYI